MPVRWYPKFIFRLGFGVAGIGRDERVGERGGSPQFPVRFHEKVRTGHIVLVHD
jgi:hypothetical protein